MLAGVTYGIGLICLWLRSWSSTRTDSAVTLVCVCSLLMCPVAVHLVVAIMLHLIPKATRCLVLKA